MPGSLPHSDLIMALENTLCALMFSFPVHVHVVTGGQVTFKEFDWKSCVLPLTSPFIVLALLSWKSTAVAPLPKCELTE